MSAQASAASTTVDAMEYLLSALRKLDFRALDEAKQQAGVTYADVSVAARLKGQYPPADGFSAHGAEYAAVMAQVDELTGTTGTYPRWSRLAIGGAA